MNAHLVLIHCPFAVSLQQRLTNSTGGYKIKSQGVISVAQQSQTQLVSVRLQVQSLASISGLRLQCCHKLWYRSQMWLGSHGAVEQAGSYSSDLIPSLGTSICCGSSPRKGKKTNKKKCHLSYKSDNGIQYGRPSITIFSVIIISSSEFLLIRKCVNHFL